MEGIGAPLTTRSPRSRDPKLVAHAEHPSLDHDSTPHFLARRNPPQPPLFTAVPSPSLQLKKEGRGYYFRTPIPPLPASTTLDKSRHLDGTYGYS